MINQLVGLSDATLSPSQYFLTLSFVVAAGLALLAGFIRACTTGGEVGSRYRTATIARLCVASVACASYVAMLIALHTPTTRPPEDSIPTVRQCWSRRCVIWAGRSRFRSLPHSY